MKHKILWCGLSFLLVAALVLGSCAKEAPGEQEEEEEPVGEQEEEPDLYEEYMASLSEGEYPVPRECFEQAIEEGRLYIYEWAGWWPEEIYDGFSEEFGIEITRDYLSSGEEVIAKYTLNPETPYDLLNFGGAPENYFLQQLNALGQLNHDWLPNVFEYLPEKYLDNKYDPGWETSVSWCYMTWNYEINTKYVDDPRFPSWAVFFEPMEEFNKRITVTPRMHAIIGAALKYLGYDWYSDDEAELREAGDLLMKLKPYILAFDGWPWKPMLEEEVWIGHITYGDGWRLHVESEDIIPALPTEGDEFKLGTVHFPIAAPHPAAAHLFLNYVSRPEVMAVLTETCWHNPLHTAVPELLSEELRGKLIPEWYYDKFDHFDPRGMIGKALEIKTAIWTEFRQ